jgi:dTDP-4-dehydrorhamnose reductase
VTRLLVAGASGLLGGEIVLAALSRDVEVVSVAARTAMRLPPQARALMVDLASPEAEAVVREAHPDWIVNAAAAVDVDGLEAEPDRAARLNTLLPERLARVAGTIGARYIHISSDAVFDGRSTRAYRESDEPTPLSVYGASKLRGEQAVRAANPAALTVRTTIYGWNAKAKLSLAEWFLGRLETGSGVDGFSDAWFTPINTAHLAEGLLDLLAEQVWPPQGLTEGILHLAGGECLTKYEFGRRLASAFGFDPAVVRPVRMADHHFKAPRALRACLDSSQAAMILGRPAPSVDAGIQRLVEDRETGRQSALRMMGGQG